MAAELKNAYFRKLRMIYCSELQLISLLPELREQITGFKLASSVEGLLRLCRERRNALEGIADEHGSAVAGDDCDMMRRLVAEGRHELRHFSRGQSRDGIVSDICLSVHRLLVANYSIARRLALRLELTADAARIAELVDLIEERIPRACDDRQPTMPEARPVPAMS